MKALVCELCEGNNFIKEDGFFVCQHCGTKYTTEEAKKIMLSIEGSVDVSGSTVKIDDTTELNNLYQLARRARKEDNGELAGKYYSQIIIKNPYDWEANFYTTYFQSINCTIAQIGNSAVTITNCLNSTFRLIKENVNETEQYEIISEIVDNLIKASNLFYSQYKSWYNNIDIQVRSNYILDFVSTGRATSYMLFKAGDYIIDIFFKTKYNRYF